MVGVTSLPLTLFIQSAPENSAFFSTDQRPPRIVIVPRSPSSRTLRRRASRLAIWSEVALASHSASVVRCREVFTDSDLPKPSDVGVSLSLVLGSDFFCRLL